MSLQRVVDKKQPANCIRRIRADDPYKLALVHEMERRMSRRPPVSGVPSLLSDAGTLRSIGSTWSNRTDFLAGDDSLALFHAIKAVDGDICESVCRP